MFFSLLFVVSFLRLLPFRLMCCVSSCFWSLFCICFLFCGCVLYSSATVLFPFSTVFKSSSRDGRPLNMPSCPHFLSAGQWGCVITAQVSLVFVKVPVPQWSKAAAAAVCVLCVCVCVRAWKKEGENGKERETDAGCLVSRPLPCSHVPSANAAQKNRRCEQTAHYSYQCPFIHCSFAHCISHPPFIFFIFFFYL